jgi:hypothetical protein
MIGNNYRNVSICKTIITLAEACESMSRNLTSKDDKVTTYLETYDMIGIAIKEQIKLLAYENGLRTEEG